MEKMKKMVCSRIKLVRISKGMKQQDLAEKIGVSQAHMSNMEGGRSSVTLENLLKIHIALDCPVASFFVDIDGAPAKNESDNMFSLDDLVAALTAMKK